MAMIGEKPALIFLATVLTLTCIQARSALPQQGYITGDDVLVRSAPNTTGDKIGALNRNTKVDILQKSDSKTQTGSEEHHWYRIRRDKLDGWIHGKYITFDLENKFDPYGMPDDMQWFYKRFGHSTHFLTQDIKVDTFTIDEYRSLIANFFNSQQDAPRQEMKRALAINALSASLFKHMKEHPGDPKYRDLMAAASTQAFIEKIFRMNSYWLHLDYSHLPEIDDKAFLLEMIDIDPRALAAASSRLKNDKEAVLAAVKKSWQMLENATPELRNDHDIVLAAVNNNGMALQYASEKMRDNKEIVLTAVSKNSSALPYASLQLRADKDILLKAAQKNGNMLKYAINPDRDAVTAAVSQNGNALQYVPYQYMRDEPIKTIAFNQEGRRGKWQAANPEQYTRFGDIGLVNGDHVRVRTEPSPSGQYLGVLYKNMLVDVLGESKQQTLIDNEVHHWYEVKADEIRGWIYGKYLTFYVPNKNITPYTSSGIGNPYEEYGEVGWFYQRFGYSTNFDTSKINADSFTLDQYRDLITSAEQGLQTAMRVLKASIYAHLKKYPDDPEYAFLKKKLYSADFIAKTAQGDNLSYLPDSILGDREIAKLLVTKNGLYLEHVSPALRNDREIVKLATDNRAQSFQFASENIRSDRAFFSELLATNNQIYQYGADNLRSDRGLALIAVNKNGRQLQFVPDDLKRDREIVMAAVQNQGLALSFAAETLKSDRETVMAAIKQNGLALQYADPAYQREKAAVLTAVTSNGSAIKYADNEFKSDREIVLAAVKSAPSALLLIPDALKSDKELIHIALKNVRYTNILAPLFNLVNDQPADIIDALKALWQNQESRHYHNYGFDLVGKQHWSDKNFILEVASAWDDISGCPFYRYINSALRNDRDFNEKLRHINVICSP